MTDKATDNNTQRPDQQKKRMIASRYLKTCFQSSSPLTLINATKNFI